MTVLIPRQREWTFQRIVAELPFIPATSNWLKLLCSLLAEPQMFVSSLCIIAETVLPGTSTWPGLLDPDGPGRKPVRQGHVEIQEVPKEQSTVMYPLVPDVSTPCKKMSRCS